LLKKKYLLNIEMSDCFAIAQQNCFPTSVAEVYADAAAAQVYGSAVIKANKYRYQNAFIDPSPYCFSPCGQPQDTSDSCNYNCIYRKYGNGCAINVCNPFDQNLACSSGGPNLYSNPVQAEIRAFTEKTYPQVLKAFCYSCTSC
jgi:hypothetical protein